MSTTTAVVWFRRDLRVRDLPALSEAVRASDRVVPLFVFDRQILGGRFASAGRTAWMLGCLRALDEALRERGGRLVVRDDDADVIDQVVAVAREVGASAVHVSDDVTPYARRRDDRAAAALAEHGIAFERHPGNYVTDVGAIRTKQGKPYTVFSPFLKTWKTAERRDVVGAPRKIELPSKLRVGRLPSLASLGFAGDPALQDVPEPGEEGGRRAAAKWLKGGLAEYGGTRDVLDAPTSRMGAYLRFGCISARWLEQRCLDTGGEAARAYLDEIAWRDFYAAVLLHFPHVATQEFVEKYRSLEWVGTEEDRTRWAEGRTGFPVVDAAMRQLLATGFMHNRARMIVGSFLTKDLGVDWRFGEARFMHHLLDGDVPPNNGGWQWIASTGTDPAPYFQRLFNPMTQQAKFDPDGAYVRRWCPELRRVPLRRLAAPWEMTAEEQEESGCRIGEDWPQPVVDHAEARRAAIERYQAASSG